LRTAFANEIESLSSMNERIVLLSGDIGNRMFDNFKEKFPDRFYNCGVSEANMTGIAAGMALCGLRPVTYTITAFNTLRCLEQIRVDVCYQNLPVIIVGVGGGLSYASLNATHHALEDIACLRVLPNMTVICPGDAWEVRAALRAALEIEGPVYIRMAKKNEPLIHKNIPDFTIGKGLVIKGGKDICFLNAGSLLPFALEAAKTLEKTKNISVHVVSMHTVKPLDEELLGDVFSKFSHVFTLEEHGMLGGFGGSIAEWLSDQKNPKAKLSRIGTGDFFMYEAGEKEHAQEFFGITTEQIVEKVLKSMSQ
jgi:transketolase